MEDGAEDEQVAVYRVEFGQLAGDPHAIYRMLQQATYPGVVHRLGRRRCAERGPEILIRDHLLEERSEMFVLEIPSGAFELCSKGPPVQLSSREVVFFRDVFGPQETQLVELYLQGAAILVGVSLGFHVGRTRCLVEELLGE